MACEIHSKKEREFSQSINMTCLVPTSYKISCLKFSIEAVFIFFKWALRWGALYCHIKQKALLQFKLRKNVKIPQWNLWIRNRNLHIKICDEIKANKLTIWANNIQKVNFGILKKKCHFSVEMKTVLMLLILFNFGSRLEPETRPTNPIDV